MQIPGMDQTDLIDALENKTVKQCIEYGVGEGVAAKWMAQYGEAYLIEKLAIVKSYQQKGKITSSEARLLVCAVRDDYKDDEQLAHQKIVQFRDETRRLREAEYEESERQAEEARQRRNESRSAVQSHLDALSKEALNAQKLAFIEVF